MTTEKSMRDYVVGLDREIPLPGGEIKSAINFDNAATTPPFKSVMEKINHFASWYSSIHRGKGYKSRLTTKLYERSRRKVADFVGADVEKDTIIFVKNTTEAINKLAYRLDTGNNKDVILATEMEHHSNDLPWRDKYTVDYIKVNRQGKLSLSDLEAKLIKYQERVKLVTVAGISNVTGYVNPIEEIAAITHTYGARILVDGAQLIPHLPFTMANIDFLAFSAHKMYAPFGTGVLIGPRDIFSSGSPDYRGGGTVKLVTGENVIWEHPPHKEEAGTPNIMGVISLTEAIKTLREIKMSNVEEREKTLLKYTVDRLKKIPEIILYADYSDPDATTAIIPFNIKNLHHDLVSSILAAEGGIAVRNGCFCAQPYLQTLLNIQEHKITVRKPRPGMVRISFGLYNTIEEVDRLISLLVRIVNNKKLYAKKYQQ